MINKADKWWADPAPNFASESMPIGKPLYSARTGNNILSFPMEGQMNPPEMLIIMNPTPRAIVG